MSAGTALSLHRLLLRLAFAASNVFAWLFIFLIFSSVYLDITQALIQTAALYALSQVTSALLTPLCAMTLKRGVRRQIMLAVVLLSSVTVLLGSSLHKPSGISMLVTLLVFAIVHGWYRALYWVPYEVERIDTHSRSSRFTTELLLALLPVFVGYVLEFYGAPYAFVLFGAALAMLCSVAPLFFIPETFERFSWGYRESFGTLFFREHRRLFISSLIDGAQGAALLLIWPLAIFLMTARSFALFGSVFSLSLLVLIIAKGSLASSSKTAKKGLFDSVPVRAAIVASAWLARLFVFSPLSIVASDAYLHAGRSHISVDNATNDQASDGHHYIDELTVLREVSLMIGRMLLCIIFVVALELLPFTAAFGVVFLIAAACAGMSVLLASTLPR